MQPRPTHAWAAGNEPIPPGYPPVEVSYVLQVERDFIDDTRYAAAGLLELRPGMDLLDAIRGAMCIVGRARANWHAALAASTSLASRPASMDDVKADLSAMAERVYHPARGGGDSATVDLRAAYEAGRDAGKTEQNHANDLALMADNDRLKQRQSEDANEITKLRAELARARVTTTLWLDPSEAMPPPGRREMTLSAMDAARAQGCIDLVYRLRDGDLPMNGEFQFVAWEPTREFLKTAAAEALTGIKLPDSFWDQWADEEGASKIAPALSEGEQSAVTAPAATTVAAADAPAEERAVGGVSIPADF